MLVIKVLLPVKGSTLDKLVMLAEDADVPLELYVDSVVGNCVAHCGGLEAVVNKVFKLLESKNNRTPLNDGDIKQVFDDVIAKWITKRRNG